METIPTTAGATTSVPDLTIPAGRSERTGPSLDDFVVGGWLVQPTLGRLSRGRTTIRLRPQLIDLLVCLASGNGRTVGKQELLDKVWDDRFVGDTAIARAVAELRQALGDDARQPLIIETIPKRGYRVIAPVTRSVRAPAGGQAATLDAPMASDARLVTGFWPLVVLLVAVVTVVLLLLARLPA